MPRESGVTLRFERDSLSNTTIIDHDGNILYTLATDFPFFGRPVTRVHDGSGKRLVAEWKWRRYAFSDLLSIRDRPQAPASTWLKKSFVPFCDDAKFLDDAGTEYTWKKNNSQLFGPQSKTLPVARFIRGYKDYKVNLINPPVVPSTLLLDERVEPIRDFILVSFLLLERRRRETEKANHRAHHHALLAQNGASSGQGIGFGGSASC